MRGKFLHSQILTAKLCAHARAMGLAAREEVPTGPGPRCGYADLVVEDGCRRVIIEVELSARRVANDLTKAAKLGAQELWIVVPDAKTRRQVQRRLQQLGVSSGGGHVAVLLFSRAVKRLSQAFPLSSRANVPGKTNTNGRETMQ